MIDQRPQPGTLEFDAARLERLLIQANTPSGRGRYRELVQHAQFNTVKQIGLTFGAKGMVGVARVVARHNRMVR